MAMGVRAWRWPEVRTEHHENRPEVHVILAQVTGVEVVLEQLRTRTYTRRRLCVLQGLSQDGLVAVAQALHVVARLHTRRASRNGVRVRVRVLLQQRSLAQQARRA